MANTLSLKVVYNPGGGEALTAIGETDKLYFQKSGAFSFGSGGAVASGSYNGGFHIISAADAELCAAGHPTNLARGTANGKVSINGASEVDVSTVTTAQCLNLLAECSPNAEVTAASMFVYDGSVEANVPTNWTWLAFKQGGAAFAACGGSAAALDLGTGESAATHNRYFGVSNTPTSNGELTGTMKCSMTFV